ncbi:CoA transferase subunit A [Metabacillus fastidiosus]|uniref:CoA transferase subunit A n=1 Tax=Metabacillus fastidiosus TaxID=1458 RepID=UPI002E20B6F2|nr:CoA transferase subunit A [Metabacillus fastidiosus]
MGQKVKKIEEVIDVIKSGSTIMIGGFGGVGNPPTLIQAILDRGIDRLTIICNDTGFPNIGVGRLVANGRVEKVIASHIGSNPIAGRLMEEGKLEVEFSPQGTLAERIRAGGVGLGGVLTDVGIDNEIVRKGKKIVEAGGHKYLLETALTADAAIIFGKESDHFGNLIYDKSARNMNPLMAMAADYTIAEVASIVPDGSLDAESIITPGVFVQAVIKTDGVNWKWGWE